MAPPDPSDAPPPAPSSRWTRAKRLAFVAATAEPRFLLLPRPKGIPGWFLRLSQGAVLTFRCFRVHHGPDRAGALAFHTILSFLPILLLGLAVFGAWGVPPERMDRVRAWILENFQGDAAPGMQRMVEDSLASLQKASSGLGIAGLVAMLLVAHRLIDSLERTFAAIGGVKRSGSKWRRVAGFWTTLVLAPLAVLVSFVLTGVLEALAASDRETIRAVGHGLGVVAPLVPGWFALLLAYTFLPGRTVRFGATARGALAAALSWELLKAGFALYCKHAFLTRTVLAGMGVIPVFLLWLYLSWSVFLLGAEAVLVAEDYDASLESGGVVDPDAAAPAPAAPVSGAPSGPPPGP